MTTKTPGVILRINGHDKSEDEYRQQLQTHFGDVPVETRETIIRYLFHGLKPGGFVSTVIHNNLLEAFQLADHANKQCLERVVLLVNEEMPPKSRGSYHYWIKTLTKLQMGGGESE